jgi:hypothetical protein
VTQHWNGTAAGVQQTEDADSRAEFCVQGAAVKRNFDKTWHVAKGEGNLKFNFEKDALEACSFTG